MTITTSATVDAALAASLRALACAKKSEATIRAYRTDLQQYVSFLSETNWAVDVEECLTHLAAQGLSETTRGR